MSIVYDYLKQIQEKKEPPKNNVPPEPKTKAPFPLWIKIVMVLLACLAVGLAVYFLAPRAVKPIVKLYRSPVEAENVPMLRSAEPSYMLEGIIYNPTQPFAIINGRMLETKGKIGDFEVVKITPDSVVLSNVKDGTTRTIRL